MGHSERDTSEGVREIRTLGLAVVCGAGGREAGEAGIESSVGRQALGILRCGFAVGRVVVGGCVDVVVHNFWDAVLLASKSLNTYVACKSKVSIDTNRRVSQPYSCSSR